MRKALIALLLSSLSASASAQPKSDTSTKPIAITHVTVIDTNSATVKRDMTVVIAGAHITAIGPSRRSRVPIGAQVIDATGKFLIPGLWDMHVHLGGDDFDKREYLRLFIANGVTGIRIMNGLRLHHSWRKEILSGGLPGPRMVIASRIIDGSNSFASGAVKVSNADEARAAVRKAKQEGADFIKVHDTLSRDVYFVIIDEAKRLGLNVAGHVPAAITAKEASEAGQKSIEHFTGLAEAENDATKAGALIAIFKKNHTSLCPTLIMRNNYAVLDDRTLESDPRLRYIKPSSKKSWLNMLDGANKMPAGEWSSRRETVRREKSLVGRFALAGVSILLGTDNGNPFVMPGFSVHDELALLVESGLTSMQALQTATMNPAKFLHQSASLGSIERGKLADLVLLDADPLRDINNTTRISATVVNGHWVDRRALDNMLREIEAAAGKNQ